MFNSSGGTIDRYQYGYDADGNVLYSDNIVSSGNSELYTYDGLNRLSTYEVGTLDGGDASISSPTVDDSWSLDALGNWNSETTLAGTTDDTIDSQNQITAIGSSSLTYDYNGNTLTDGTGASYTYDAWNRMVDVTGVPIGAATYHESLSYTASGTRPVTQVGYTLEGDPVEEEAQTSYYSASGQLLSAGLTTEHFVSGHLVSEFSTRTQYMWGLMYVNDLVARDDNIGGGSLGISGSGLGERLYSTANADFSITSLTNTSGGVVERFTYSAYGTQSVFNASYGSVSDSYAWVIGFQGGVTDPITGFVHFDARDYDPATGRWMEADPGGYVNGPNTYEFEMSAPITSVDPSGFAAVASGALSRGSASAYTVDVSNGNNGDNNGDDDGGDGDGDGNDDSDWDWWDFPEIEAALDALNAKKALVADAISAGAVLVIYFSAKYDAYWIVTNADYQSQGVYAGLGPTHPVYKHYDTGDPDNGEGFGEHSAGGDF